MAEFAGVTTLEHGGPTAVLNLVRFLERVHRKSYHNPVVKGIGTHMYVMFWIRRPNAVRMFCLGSYQVSPRSREALVPVCPSDRPSSLSPLVVSYGQPSCLRIEDSACLHYSQQYSVQWGQVSPLKSLLPRLSWKCTAGLDVLRGLWGSGPLGIDVAMKTLLSSQVSVAVQLSVTWWLAPVSISVSFLACETPVTGHLVRDLCGGHWPQQAWGAGKGIPNPILVGLQNGGLSI